MNRDDMLLYGCTEEEIESLGELINDAYRLGFPVTGCEFDSIIMDRFYGRKRDAAMKELFGLKRESC